MLNRQMVFNDVWTKLFAQGHSAQTVIGSCRYRTSDGAKCAVGHLIPDGLYDGEMEGSTASDPLVYSKVDPKYGPVDHIVCHGAGSDVMFLRGLQRAHDLLNHIDNPDDWRSRFVKRMDVLAESWGLSTEGLPRVDAAVDEV